MQSVIIFDLETAPDLEAVARVHGLATFDESAAAELAGDKFQKAPLHRIVCIGALVADREGGAWRTRALGAPHLGDRTEAELISTFVGRIDALRPCLVSFNGNGFDLPVLRYRAMVHKVGGGGLNARPYFKRYDESAVDLCDVLSSFDARSKMSLDGLCRVLGLPGKPAGVDGSKVGEYVRDGRIQEVADYCESDVVNTYRVWLRYELFRGALTREQFDESEADLTAYITARIPERPHLAFMVPPTQPTPEQDPGSEPDVSPATLAAPPAAQ